MTFVFITFFVYTCLGAAFYTILDTNGEYTKWVERTPDKGFIAVMLWPLFLFLYLNPAYLNKVMEK